MIRAEILQIFLFCIVTGNGILSSSDTKGVQIGESFELPCDLLFSRDRLFVWSKVDKSIPFKRTLLSSGYNLNIKNDRVTVKPNRLLSTPSLHVMNAQATDQGQYQCQVSNGDDEKTSWKIDVLIATKPIIFENSTTYVFVTEGDNVKLECYAGGYPSPKSVSFMRKYVTQPTESSQNHENFLTKNNVTKEDRGEYVCEAKNEIGITRHNVSFNVEFAPTVSVLKPEVKQALGYGMDLQCDCTGCPAPIISWLKNEELIKNNDHYTISSDTSGDLVQSVLRIVKAEKDHFGRYECLCTNKFAIRQSFVKFTETKNPVCPPACEPPKSVASAGSTHNHNVLTGLFLLHVLYIFFN